MSLGRRPGNSCVASLRLLNATNRHLLIDDSLTSDGVHYDDPRYIYAEFRYRFNY